MNAKITLTVPMEKVPQQVSKILLDLAAQLNELASNTKTLSLHEDQINVLKSIDGLRKALTVIDANYDDCYSILVGYLRYETEKNIQRMMPQTQEPNNDKQSNG